jgi:hypothetical protein
MTITIRFSSEALDEQGLDVCYRVDKRVYVASSKDVNGTVESQEAPSMEEAIERLATRLQALRKYNVCPKCQGPALDLRNAGFAPDKLREQRTCHFWNQHSFTCNTPGSTSPYTDHLLG